MSPNQQEQRLLEDLRSYFGYAEDQLEFVWSDNEGIHHVIHEGTI